MDKISFYWGIVSYKRADRQPMLNYLHEMGYSRDEIILSTQTKEDYKAYKELYDQKAVVIYAEGNNVSENKNNLLKYITEKCGNKRVVLCSDKVRAVQYLPKTGKKLLTIETREQMDNFIHKAFFVTKQLQGSAFGCYPTVNTLYMSHTMSTNLQMLGCFMGLPDPSLQLFDPEQPLKEDFEFILRHVKNGRRTIRFNDICLKATLHTQGGCHDAWSDNEIQRKCNKRLLSLYAGLVTLHTSRTNEQRYIGPTVKINKSILDI